MSISATPAGGLSMSLFGDRVASLDTVYTKLPLPLKTSTRLLKLTSQEDGSIRCQLEVIDLASEPEYRALSYTWGPPTNEAKERGMTADRSCSIICNSNEILITENLFHFLRLASENLEEYGGYFWIDAICINQDDKTEKTSEVMKMANIYRSAASVLVWLGESDEYSGQAIELISVLATLSADELADINPVNITIADVVAAKLGSSITPNHWESLNQFFNRNWFTRAWIIQEMLLASEANVLCGTQQLEWKSLTSVSAFVGSSRLREIFTSPVPGTTVRICTAASPAVLEVLKSNMRMGNDWRLERILVASRGYFATEKNDKIYAILSISKEPFLDPQYGDSTLIPDYTRDPVETYTLVSRLILQHSEDLLLLSMVEDATIRTFHGLPSWAPDWSVSFAGIGICVGNYFSASANRMQKHRISETAGLLLVQGIFVDVVTGIGPSNSDVGKSWYALKEWLEILKHLNPVYITGESRIEAFWRTLILDVDFKTEEHPAPQSMESSFWKWVQSCLVISGGEDKDAEWAYLDELARNNNLALERTEMSATIARLVNENVLDDIFSQVIYYSMSFGVFCFSTLFRTLNGFLGLGPVSIRPGDEVWILPGAKVPFVLRKTSKDRRYRIVGDAYLHGFMHGEVFINGEPELVNIEIE